MQYPRKESVNWNAEASSLHPNPGREFEVFKFDLAFALARKATSFAESRSSIHKGWPPRSELQSNACKQNTTRITCFHRHGGAPWVFTGRGIRDRRRSARKLQNINAWHSGENWKLKMILAHSACCCVMRYFCVSITHHREQSGSRKHEVSAEMKIEFLISSIHNRAVRQLRDQYANCLIYVVNVQRTWESI